MAHDPSSSAPQQPERRGFLSGFFTISIAGMLAALPFGSGIATLLDPIFRKSGGSDAVKIAKLEAVPDDGIPRRFPVIADRRDAWNYYPDDPIGAVYLRRLPGEKKVEAFQANCPHAGCFVNFVEQQESGVFSCPCHTSTFNVEGKRINLDHCESPRDLDTLAVDEKRLEQGEVWVEFKTFKTGVAEKVAIG